MFLIEEYGSVASFPQGWAPAVMYVAVRKCPKRKFWAQWAQLTHLMLTVPTDTKLREHDSFCVNKITLLLSLKEIPMAFF